MKSHQLISKTRWKSINVLYRSVSVSLCVVGFFYCFGQSIFLNQREDKQKNVNCFYWNRSRPNGKLLKNWEQCWIDPFWWVYASCLLLYYYNVMKIKVCAIFIRLVYFDCITCSLSVGCWFIRLPTFSFASTKFYSMKNNSIFVWVPILIWGTGGSGCLSFSIFTYMMFYYHWYHYFMWVLCNAYEWRQQSM